MNGEVAEPSSQRKVSYRKLALLFVAAGVVMLVLWLVLEHTKQLAAPDREPWFLGIRIFQLLMLFFWATMFAWFSNRLFRAAQLPLPDSLRTRMKTGRLLLFAAWLLLAIAGFTLFMGGLDTGLIIAGYIQRGTVGWGP